jgi:YidC/Oxa1 family membrane protein insertase
VVGAGTPAESAGIKPGDVITRLDETKIENAVGFLAALETTKPGQDVEVAVQRRPQGANGQGDVEKKTLRATLVRMPAQVIRPELAAEPIQIVKRGGHDPLSLLFTLQEVDGKRIGDDATELAGVNLRTGIWKGEQIDERTVEFVRDVGKYNLRAVKRYQLAKIDDANPDASYHLIVDIRIENLSEEPHVVAYYLDGPNGLPIEGWWYLYKNRISTEWFTSLAVRDMALRFEGRNAGLVSGLKIADESAQPFGKEPADAPLVYTGVDSQYFASVLLPQRGKSNETWFADIRPLRVGDVPADASRKKLTNVSCRLVSNAINITPDNPLTHRYQLFVGPKRPDVLASYGTEGTTLSQLVYFGWAIWGVVARLMTQILHFFYSFVGNYGIAIIMLTVLVRLCMFPLSRKQALAAQKMQELQPEMKQINEKYKGNNEARARAMQELWRKHNYNPMGGCLLALVQLPIFIGLYRALMIDVELRGAPLFGDAVRWCSNLGAPDMLYDWSGWMPGFIADPGHGWLGPYFNLLPIITIGLFLVQQKMFMPPATDEQTAMQQKIMTYMMIFMGFLFYTVASGLCLYFIASSLWGIGEKKLLPKLIGTGPAKTPATSASRVPALVTSGGNGAAQRGSQRKKHRGRK